MTKILHVIDKLSMDGVNPSSCSKLFVEWFAQHDRARFKIMIASLRAKDAAGEYLEERGLEVFYINKGKVSFANVSAIASLIDEHEIELLHLHGYSSANFGRLAARRKRIPSVMHEHAILKVQPHQFIADWLLRNKTDVAVAVSNAVKDFLIKGRSVPQEKIQVIWNGINLAAYLHPNLQSAAQFRARFATREQRLIGMIGRLRAEKGNRYFIQAAHEIWRHEPRARFVLIGEGEDRPQLERLVNELGLQGRLLFAGFVNDVQAALNACDVVVVPSLREGFGLILAEAMAAGRPIVATRVGGMIEMAQHEKHVLFVPPANSVAIAQAVLRLLRDESLAARLANATREHSENFSIVKNVAALEALYSKLARKHDVSGLFSNAVIPQKPFSALESVPSAQKDSF